MAGSASTIALLKERQGAAWLPQLELPYLWIDTEGRSGGVMADGLRAMASAGARGRVHAGG